ncbi:tape measure protein, partial [Leptolyngbya sp. FACHB-36]|nr:tape measure protein [Leptolyngbya sp. FACHB-36]
MQKLNQQAIAVGQRITQKYASFDPGVVGDRALSNQAEAEAKPVIARNQREFREQRRLAFEQERKGNVIDDEPASIDLTRILDEPARQNPFKRAQGLFRDLKGSLRDGSVSEAQKLLPDSKTLLNDIRTAQITTAAQGDTEQSKKLQRTGDRAERAIEGTQRILNKPLDAVTGKDLAQIREYRRELLGVFKLLDRPAPTGGNPLSGLLDGLGKLKPLLGPIAAGFLGFQGAQAAIGFLKQFGSEALDASIKLNNLKTSLKFSSGGAAQGAADLTFVRKTVDDLGTPLGAAQQGFVKLSAATRGTTVEGQATKEVFTGLQQASTVLGLSADDTSGAILALSQSASKGKVQAEELRGQLGERIPGAFGIAARAMGVTEAALNGMLERGEVMSSEFLPKFARQLQTEFGGAAQSAAQNIQSSFNRLDGANQQLKESFGEAFQPAIKAAVDALT